MIAGPLVTPAHAGPTRVVPIVATAVRVVGVVLCVVALGGALAWISQLSPLHFSRWDSIDTLHNLPVDEPGRYVIFEEGDGAAGRVGPPGLAISVRSTAGRVIPVRSELDDSGRSSTSYQLPFLQGRALVSFDIDRAGRYVVLTYPVSPDEPPDASVPPTLDLSNMPPLAIARIGEPSSLGSVAGLAVVAGIPALVGVTVLVVAGLVWPSPVRRPARARRRRRSDAEGRTDASTSRAT